MIDFSSDSRSYFPISLHAGFLFLFLNARCVSYQFIASLIMELGLINISPWSAGTPLSFSAEGEGRTIEEQGLLWSRFSRLLQRVVPSSL